MEPKHLPPPPSPPTVQSQAPLLTCVSCWTAAHGINSSSYSWQPFSHPHKQWFISQLELTVSSQEYLKELRILLFQRALYKIPNRDVLKKGNYYFFLYNNYICFKSLYAHEKVVCYSAGFSYSVLMWPRFAVCTVHYCQLQDCESGSAKIINKLSWWTRILFKCVTRC